MNRKWRLNKVINLMIFGMAIGTLVAGCGGGGGGGDAVTGDAAASYLADQQGGSFVGRWWYEGSISAVAKADTETVVATGTNQYTATSFHRILPRGTGGIAGISGTWDTNPSPDVFYSLISSGWFADPDTATLVVNGNNITITPTGEPAMTVAVTKTNLANTPITCTSACLVPGSYPTGSTSYQFTASYTSTHFTVYGDTLAKPITDEQGVQLVALPLLNTTFCDPTFPAVFQAQGSGSYQVLTTASCSKADISTAITNHTVEGTVTMNSQATGNTNVPTVLHVQSATGNALVSPMGNMIYGARADAVGYGWMLPVGTYQFDASMNKTAINAQLLANGLVEIP